MHTVSLFSENGYPLVRSDTYVLFPFIRHGEALAGGSHPCCGITLKKAGSMRFRWNEENPVRGRFFSQLGAAERIVPLELIHSRIVYAAAEQNSTEGMQGDGIISVNRALVLSVTVADCVPVYLYDPVSSCFAMLHSGWKGTGIVQDALAAAEHSFGSRATDFCAVIGPHIQQCCYTVDGARASFFSERFSPDCVSYDEEGGAHLSLAAANTALLTASGVPADNIVHVCDCTCCDGRFGSFRREAAHLPDSLPLAEKTRRFTAMAAFCGFI